MSNSHLSKLLSTALLGSTVSLLLVGCQPAEQSKTETDNSATEVDHHHEEHADEHEHEHDHEAHDEHDHAEGEHDAHDHHDHDHDHDHGRIMFNCEPTAKLGVFYHTDSTPKTAHILIDGIEYDFVQDTNLAEEAYVSNFGLDDNHGLVWHVQQQQGDLYAVATNLAKAGAIGSLDDLQKNKKLYSCQQEAASHD